MLFKTSRQADNENAEEHDACVYNICTMTSVYPDDVVQGQSQACLAQTGPGCRATCAWPAQHKYTTEVPQCQKMKKQHISMDSDIPGQSLHSLTC